MPNENDLPSAPAPLSLDALPGDARFQPGRGNEVMGETGEGEGRGEDLSFSLSPPPLSDDNPAEPTYAETQLRANQRTDLEKSEQERLRTLQQLGYVDKSLNLPRDPPTPTDESKLSLAGWREWLTIEHAAHPQKQYLALAALKSIESGVTILHSLGHEFALKARGVGDFLEWPKMFYHDQMGTLVVHSPEAASQLTAGWRDTPRPRDEAPPPTPIADTNRAELSGGHVFEKKFSVDYEDKKEKGNELVSAPPSAMAPKED